MSESVYTTPKAHLLPISPPYLKKCPLLPSDLVLKIAFYDTVVIKTEVDACGLQMHKQTKMKPWNCVNFVKPEKVLHWVNFISHHSYCKNTILQFKNKSHLMLLGLGTSVSYSWPFSGKLSRSPLPKKKCSKKLILNRKKMLIT